jgi:hypothetical protein
MPFVPKTLTLTQYNTDSEQESEEENANPPDDLNKFLNSLFDPWPGPFAYNPGPLFRAPMARLIKEAEEQSGGNPIPPICWLVDNATVTLMVDILEGYWRGYAVRDNFAPREIEYDKKFINKLRNYIDNNNLQMRVPRFRCTAVQNNAPTAYEFVDAPVQSFKNDDGLWDSAVVRRFLELLLAGAHFVVVHSADDLGANVEMPSFFNAFSGWGTSYAQHSHYTDKPFAPNGVNYPKLELVSVEGDTLDELKNRKDAVLLPVVLCDTTASVLKNYNSFFQMEGWRPNKSMYWPWPADYKYNHQALAGGYRHGADFATHQKTLWNISTYGASLFSEKRGAPIFLAPPAWMNKGTHLYTGFGGPDAKHKWFKSDLVTGLP